MYSKEVMARQRAQAAQDEDLRRRDAWDAQERYATKPWYHKLFLGTLAWVIFMGGAVQSFTCSRCWG
jgi:hypothetical protein